MSGYTHLARFYDTLTQNVGYPRRAQYFDTLIQQHRPGRGLLLDLACGTGSLSLELAALGYDVIGADASEDMLAVAVQKAAMLERPPLFLRQAMEELDLFGTVECCICALDSINHLADEAALDRLLERLVLFIEPGGLFLFDVNTAYKHRRVLAGNTFIYDTPEVYCVWQNGPAGPQDEVEITLDYFVPQSGAFQRYTESFSERIFAHDTLEKLLDKHGFSKPVVYGEDSLHPPGPEEQRLVYVTRHL